MSFLILVFVQPMFSKNWNSMNPQRLSGHLNQIRTNHTVCIAYIRTPYIVDLLMFQNLLVIKISAIHLFYTSYTLYSNLYYLYIFYISIQFISRFLVLMISIDQSRSFHNVYLFANYIITYQIIFYNWLRSGKLM